MQFVNSRQHPPDSSVACLVRLYVLHHWEAHARNMRRQSANLAAMGILLNGVSPGRGCLVES